MIRLSDEQWERIWKHFPEEHIAGDSEPAPPCAHPRARAREIIEEFRLVPLRRRYVQRRRAARRYHADVGAGLVGAAWSSVMALSISEPRLA